MSARRRREAGFTFVELLVGAGVLVVVLIGVIVSVEASLRQAAWAKELDYARLAAARVRQSVSAVRFRGQAATDDAEWLFRGGYRIAQNVDGTAFVLPDLRTAPVISDQGVAGWVRADFPVPGLAPPAGQTFPGRLLLHVNESLQPTALPTPFFPFEPTVGGTRLDCDGDGLITAGDLRAAHSLSANPCRLVPARIVIEWRTPRGVERHEESFLLCYRGFE